MVAVLLGLKNEILNGEVKILSLTYSTAFQRIAQFEIFIKLFFKIQ